MLRIYEEKDSVEQLNSTADSLSLASNTRLSQDTDGTPQWVESGNKIHFISLGCPRNLVDSEVMLGILLRAGYEATDTLTSADYIVINTCGFLEASRQESAQSIRDSLDQRKTTAKLIVTGCMVQTHHDELAKRFPHVDYYLGSGDVEKILEAVRSTEKGLQISSARSYLESGEVPRQLSTPKHYAYVKIAEGCRKRCSYCIIPTIKGPLKSKSKEQVIKECQILLNQGVQELILIAQDLGDYGKDNGWRGSAGLTDLLEGILSSTTQDFWLRLLYLYPDEISDELIALMQRDQRICPYIDMPIQHVDNGVLKAMRRATSREQIVTTIEKLRKALPSISIRTSLIVGFPGETEEQFQQLVDFVKKYQLDHVGIFKYSREKGSHADTLPDHLSDSIKNRRYHTLMKAQQKAVKARNSRMVGKTLQVIVEGYHPESKLLMCGRHPGQCPEIDGQVIINDGRKVTAFGKRYTLRVTDYSDYDLVGTVL
jgi:ribosomal protein S12 methylthiotransferase